MSISPHASKTLVHRHVLLWDHLHRALASIVLTGHEGWLDLWKGERKPLQGFGRWRKAKERERLQAEMCLRLKPLAGIWRHEAKRRTPRYTQKATAINKGKTPLHQCRREYGARWLRMEDRKAPLIKAMFSDLDRIKAKSLESAIFKIGSSAGTKDLIFRNEEGRWDFREG